jgi:hypothetical protein
MAGRYNTYKPGFSFSCAARAGAEKRRRTDYTRGVPVRGPSGNRPRERSNTSGWRAEALRDIDGGDLAAGGSPPAGELLTGNIGSLCE